MLFGLLLGAAFGGFGGFGRGHGGSHGGGHLDEALLVRDILNTKSELNTRICDVEKEGLRAEARLADKICDVHHSVNLNVKDCLILHERQSREIDNRFCGVEKKLEKICGEVTRIPGFIRNAGAKSTIRNQIATLGLTAAQAAILGSAIDDIDSCAPTGCAC